MNLLEKGGYAAGYVAERCSQIKSGVILNVVFQLNRANPFGATMGQALSIYPNLRRLSLEQVNKPLGPSGQRIIDGVRNRGLDPSQLYLDPSSNSYVVVDGDPATEANSYPADTIEVS